MRGLSADKGIFLQKPYRTIFLKAVIFARMTITLMTELLLVCASQLKFLNICVSNSV